MVKCFKIGHQILIFQPRAFFNYISGGANAPSDRICPHGHRTSAPGNWKNYLLFNPEPTDNFTKYWKKETPNNNAILITQDITVIKICSKMVNMDMFKDGRHVQDKVKNSLRSFTYNYIDLDLKEFNLDRRRIRILRNLNANFAILKPDKGNGIVLMKQSDYVTSVRSLFTDSTKFKKVPSDPTSTRLSSLQKYLSTLLKRNYRERIQRFTP